MEKITIFIEEKLRLKVNKTKSKVSKFNEIKHLGFGFFIDKEGCARRTNTRAIKETN